MCRIRGGKRPIRSHVIEATVQAKLGTYLLASLAAALNSGMARCAGEAGVNDNSLTILGPSRLSY